MKKSIIFILGLILCICQLLTFAQENKIDSLLNILKTEKDDIKKINLLNELSLKYIPTGEFSKGLNYSNSALSLGNEILKTSRDSILLINAQKGIVESYTNSGLIYWNKGNYGKALENNIAALKIRENIKDKKGIAISYNNIGIIYDELREFDKALSNYRAAIKINEELGDKKSVASSYNNIGVVYDILGDFDKALQNYFIALKIREEIGDKYGIAGLYNNIGLIYSNQGDYKKALESLIPSLEIYEKIGDKPRMAACYNNVGAVLLKQNKIKEARTLSLKSLNIAKEAGLKDDIKEAFLLLSYCDSSAGNWKGAYEYQKLYKLYNDSIFNSEIAQSTAEMTARYESEKKEAQIMLLEKDKEKQAAVTAVENKKQQIIIWSIISGLLLVVGFSLFIYNRLRLTMNQKKIIQEQKKIVDEQKTIVELKNKDITDSINYAKRIQQAKLPKKEEIYAVLPQSFILFKPKDIVSGDFYWFHKNDKSIFIAAADCTGHGVPGAFMSLIGSEKLDDAVSQSSNTSEILRLLNKGIKNSLNQSVSHESTRDGMDIALCEVKQASPDSEGIRLKYAGANRPIWIIRKGESVIEEIKATKKAIGGLTEEDVEFVSHDIKLQAGDTFYIFSDGYADTFGGHSNKKLTTKKFKQLLLDIKEMTMQEQEKQLTNFFETWKAGTEQIDDVLVIGVRL